MLIGNTRENELSTREDSKYKMVAPTAHADKVAPAEVTELTYTCLQRKITEIKKIRWQVSPKTPFRMRKSR
jgi:hypothetical protein